MRLEGDNGTGVSQEVSETIATLLAGPAKDVIAAIGAGEDPIALMALRDAEAAGKARQTVLAAVIARLTEIAEPGQGVGAGDSSSLADAIDDGKPPHKKDAEWPQRHDGAPCTNCGISSIVWTGESARCDYCGYVWKP